MKENYTVGEIIAGTRQSYLKIEDDLKRLKELCNCYDREIKDFYFMVDRLAPLDRIMVTCVFLRKFLTVPNLFATIKDILYTHYRIDYSLYYSKSIIDSSLIKAYKASFNVEVKKDKRDEFESILYCIFHSDFLNQMNFTCSISWECTMRSHKRLLILPNGIEYIAKPENYQNNEEAVRLKYIPRIDVITILGKMFINKEILWEYLNTKVPSDSLNEYHRSLLENSLSTTKPFVFDEELNKKYIGTNYNIEEDNNQIKLMLNKDKKIEH